ncbi:MAG: hypothetical protein ACOYOB_16790 [Myxococcota bacterium]|jgi:hypothetical protein
MAQRLTHLFALLGVFVWTGCVVTSVHPHVDADKSVNDPKLFGAWVMESDKESVWLHVGPRSPAGQTLLVLNQPSKETREFGWMGGELLTAPAGTDAVASLGFEYEGKDDGTMAPVERKSWFLLRYQVSGDTLKLERLDNDATAEAIRRGEVAGEAPAVPTGPQGDKKAGPPTLQAFPQGLAAWLSHKDSAAKGPVWVEFAVFSRAKAAVPPTARTPETPSPKPAAKPR